MKKNKKGDIEWLVKILSWAVFAAIILITLYSLTKRFIK
jgi:hypothetical protein